LIECCQVESTGSIQSVQFNLFNSIQSVFIRLILDFFETII